MTEPETPEQPKKAPKDLYDQIKAVLDQHNISTATVIYTPDNADEYMLQYGHFYDNAKLVGAAMRQIKNQISKDVL